MGRFFGRWCGQRNLIRSPAQSANRILLTETRSGHQILTTRFAILGQTSESPNVKDAHVVQRLRMTHFSGNREALQRHLRTLVDAQSEFVAQTQIEGGARVMVTGSQLKVGGRHVVVLLLHVLDAQLELNVAYDLKQVLDGIGDRRGFWGLERLGFQEEFVNFNFKKK